MPQVFKIGSYWVYFWTNENDPLKPVHVSQGKPAANGTKIWITRSGRCLLANNNSRIPERTLRNIMRIIEARNEDVIQKWEDYFGKTEFYVLRIYRVCFPFLHFAIFCYRFATSATDSFKKQRIFVVYRGYNPLRSP